MTSQPPSASASANAGANAGARAIQFAGAQTMLQQIPQQSLLGQITQPFQNVFKPFRPFQPFQPLQNNQNQNQNQNNNQNNVQNNNNNQQGSNMSFSITHVGNGNFQMTVGGKTQTFNLADLNMFLRMEQIAGYDAAIADQLSEIQATNKQRKVLNGLMDKVRADTGGSFTLPGHTDSTARTVTEWFTALNITSGDKDTKIANLKNAIDNLTSDSEMQMLRFRQMVDKRGTALQEARTTLTDDKRNKEKALQG